MQLSLPLDAGPSGLGYLPDFVDADEARALEAACAAVAYHEVVMHGTAAKRTVAHFGVDYAYDARALGDAPPLPDWVRPLLSRVARAMHEPDHAIAELLVSRYPPGARIGWHRDAPMFGPVVAGLSLGAPCELRFRRRHGDGFDYHRVTVAPRSLYVLAGAARAAWQHMIPPVPGLRYSLTFRTLKRR